jgi:hypothetical protein
MDEGGGSVGKGYALLTSRSADRGEEVKRSCCRRQWESVKS